MGAGLNPAEQFEDFVGRLLRALGFNTVSEDGPQDRGFDYLATRDGVRWAVEAKYYRTARAKYALLDAAAARLSASGKAHTSPSHGMLIVTAVVDHPQKERLRERYGVVVIDRTELSAWAADLPEFADELQALVGVVAAGATDEHPLNSLDTPPALQKTVLERTVGAELCNELRLVPAGKDGWKAYEDVCCRILEHLFETDLTGWHRQSKTDDDLNRFDLVCRIRPTTEYWRFLLEDLGSRYVLFEFKNYEAAITQGQVLTTEKYLLERGLRRVAIVLTRSGASESATRMSQGAMREHGKLILVLDDDKVCALLAMKDRGEESSDLLFDVADEFLLSLPR